MPEDVPPGNERATARERGEAVVSLFVDLLHTCHFLQHPSAILNQKQKPVRIAPAPAFCKSLEVSGGDWGNRWLSGLAALQENIPADSAEEQERRGDLAGLGHGGAIWSPRTAGLSGKQGRAYDLTTLAGLDCCARYQVALNTSASRIREENACKSFSTVNTKVKPLAVERIRRARIQINIPA